MVEIYQINEDERIKLHECLIKMYCDIKFVCNKHNLSVALGGGSALGAIRHKGFIPWDDDLDLNMPRKDYDKFLSIMKDELGAEYDFSAPCTECVDSPFLKIYKKDTINYEVFGNNRYRGIWIDVFPMDTAPNYKILQAIKGFIVDFFYFVNTSMFISQKDNQLVKKAYLMSNRAWRYYTAKVVGFLCPGNYKKFYNMFDRFVSDSRSGKYLTVATGRNKYAGECMRVSDLFPLREADFEGLKVDVYKNVELYLTNLYGDYMKLPPVEKRERHYTSKFFVSDNIRWHTEQASNYHLVR